LLDLDKDGRALKIAARVRFKRGFDSVTVVVGCLLAFGFNFTGSGRGGF